MDPEAGLGPLTVNGQALTFDTRPVTPSELAFFYAGAGWTPGGRLVGYGRIVSDGGIHSWLHDLIVLPEFQKFGFAPRPDNAPGMFLYFQPD